MVETRGFRGKLNLDDNEYRVPTEDYLDALNVTRDAQAEGSDESLTNVIGNQEVETFPATGLNKVIGSYADKVRSRVYFFTWNSLGNNRITYYDLITNSIVYLIEDKTDSNGVPILNFDPSFKINHIDIIYRDEEGDLLFWTDGLNPPSKINVKTISQGTLLPLKRSYLDVAKEPPSSPPYGAYENKAINGVNKLKNKLFKFKYRFVYDDLEKSVFSSISLIELPLGGWDNNNNQINSAIKLLLQTGSKNVTDIELAGSISDGTNYSDFFLIRIYNKAQLNLADDDIFSVEFLNDEVYIPISIRESIQPFDNVPLTAYTQSLPNGNVLDYGDIREGYDLVPITGFLFNPSFLSPTITTNNIFNNLLVAAYQKLDSSYGSGDIKIFVVGSGKLLQIVNFDINPTDINGVSASGNYTTILPAIQTAALANGYTIVSPFTLSNDYIIINKPGASLRKIEMGGLLPPSEFGESTYAWNWNSEYGLGIVYFDEKGRTNGVQPFNNLSSVVGGVGAAKFKTFNYSIGLLGNLNVPYVDIILSNSPPPWASYFQLVRTKNLTKSKWVYWITDNTIKDNNPDFSGNKYAYLSITSLINYSQTVPNTPLGYEFALGDIVQIINRFNSTGSIVQQYSNEIYEIVSLVSNPVVNGTIYNGQYLQIFLPNTSPTFDFGPGFENYFVEIYTPAQNFSSDLNVYYEFGQKFPITPNGFTSSFQLRQGDSYIRQRQIQLGGTANWTSNSQTFTNVQQVILLQLQNNTTNSVYYTAKSATSQSFPDSVILQKTATPIPPGQQLSFTINIEITLLPTVSASNSLIQLQFINSSNVALLVLPNIFLGPLQAGVQTTIKIGRNFDWSTLPGVEGLRIILNFFTGSIVGMEVSISQSALVNVWVNDQNFSDDYASAASPNGRAWVYNPDALQTINPTLIRFGGEFQPGTNVNEINRFYEENFDVYDRSRGSIKKMFIEGRNQYIFQEFDVGVVTVLTQIVRDTATNPLSAESDRLLNKIVYPYIGGYGIGTVPESFAYGKNAKYFVDNNKGVICRLSTDGITPLSIIYKTNAFFVAKLSGFNANLNSPPPTTGKPTVYGCFDAYTNKYIIALEEINRTGFNQDPYTISFLESRDNKQGFESFLSYHPENMVSLNNLFISFKDGTFWKHDNPIHCEFYGTKYPSYVDAIFNQNQLIKKYFLSIFETSDIIWYCPVIKSQLNSYGAVKQETSLVEERFTLLEGQYASAILRDKNSQGGIINGDKMHGNYLIIRFKIDNTTGNLYYLNTVSLMYKESPLNLR